MAAETKQAVCSRFVEKEEEMERGMEAHSYGREGALLCQPAGNFRGSSAASEMRPSPFADSRPSHALDSTTDRRPSHAPPTSEPIQL